MSISGGRKTNDLLFSCGCDGKLIRWDFNSGKKIQEYSTKQDNGQMMMAVMIQKNEKYSGKIFSVSYGGSYRDKVLIWDVLEYRQYPLEEIKGVGSSGSNIISEIDENRFVVGNDNGRGLVVFGFQTMKAIAWTKDFMNSWIRTIWCLDDGKGTLISSCSSGKIAIYRIDKKNKVDVLQMVAAHTTECDALCLNARKDIFVSASDDRMLKAFSYSAKEKELKRKFSIRRKATTYPYRGLAVVGKYVVYSGWMDDKIRVYTLSTGKLLKTMELQVDPKELNVSNKDGSHGTGVISNIPGSFTNCLVGFIGGRIVEYNVATGCFVRLFECGHNGKAVNGLMFVSPTRESRFRKKMFLVCQFVEEKYRRMCDLVVRTIT